MFSCHYLIFSTAFLALAMCSPRLSNYNLGRDPIEKPRSPFFESAQEFPVMTNGPVAPSLPPPSSLFPIERSQYRSRLAHDAVITPNEDDVNFRLVAIDQLPSSNTPQMPASSPKDLKAAPSEPQKQEFDYTSLFSGQQLFPIIDEHSKDAFLMKNDQKTQEFQQFAPPTNGVKPKFTGSFRKGVEEPEEKETISAVGGMDAQDGAAITNPAMYYLEGMDFSKVKAPKCRMMGCDGPVPNDADINFGMDPSLAQNGQACHQVFVPLNSCVDNRGYPTGMICSICCDCASDFVNEFKKSRGYVKGYSFSE